MDCSEYNVVTAPRTLQAHMPAFILAALQLVKQYCQ